MSAALDDDTRDRIAAAAAALRELAHMPSPRRDERFARIAPELLELERVVRFAAVGELAARLGEPHFVVEQASALEQRLLTP